jgi:hypothetical protein
VVSARFQKTLEDGDYRSLEGFTGKDVRAADVSGVEFPRLVDPIDDLPPASVILSVRRSGARLVVRGVSHDNGEVASVTVNGVPAKITSLSAGVADWEAAVEPPGDGAISAGAADKAGNAEATPHRVRSGEQQGGSRRARV